MPGFPPGVHLIGGQNSVASHRRNADEFYAPIIPIVVELWRQGLSLRAIARELDKRGIKTRLEYAGQGWNASQVRRVLNRAGAVQPLVQTPGTVQTPAADSASPGTPRGKCVGTLSRWVLYRPQ